MLVNMNMRERGRGDENGGLGEQISHVYCMVGISLDK